MAAPHHNLEFDTLHIIVVEAHHLAPLDRSGTSDPYCVLKSSFNPQKFKSRIIKKTLTPKWDQEFKFFTSKADGEIYVKLWDRDLFTRDDFLGDVVLHLAEFGDGREHDRWFTLANEPEKKKKDKTPAEIHLKIKFTGPNVVLPPVEAEKEVPKPQQAAASPTSPTTTNANSKKTTPPVKTTKPTPEPPRAARIDDKYELGKVLGRGAFSVVKEGIRKATGKKYAVKCISKKLIDKKEMALLEREIDIMKKLQHPNIIQLMEVVDEPETLYLVLEYASGGELFDAIVNRGFYSEADAAKLIRQILEAILFVHNHGIAHRDLKPENLLLLGDGQEDFLKIADFGLSKDFGQEQLQTSCGTPDYVAPEVLMGEVYDMSVDIWSIGVISYVLLCGFPPFYGETQKELFENIMGGKYDFPEPEWASVSDEGKQFIKKMLVVNPEDRYTAEQALNDVWMAENSGASPAKELKRLQSFSVQKFKEYTQKYKEMNNLGNADAVKG